MTSSDTLVKPAETGSAARIDEQALAALDSSDLIDTIITRYHRVHVSELPELVQMSLRVEQVHKGNPAVPAGLAALLKEVLGELAMHMQKEELVLFPRLRHGGGPMVGQPIAMMMSEHEEHAAYLDRIRSLTNDLQVPADGCGTWRALYAGTRKFADDLVDHIHIENDILFPRFVGEAG